MSTPIARRLARALEPFAGQVYFAPECHSAYAVLGYGQSTRTVAGVEMPEMVAYFSSRGAILGDVPGELVASAFGVFKTSGVVGAVTAGKSIASPAATLSARTEGAVAQLTRILGEKPPGLANGLELLHQANEGLDVAGKPLFAGLVADGLIGSELGDAWRLADRLREYRGDAHTAAWTLMGLTACEIGMMSELYWGLPSRSYVRSRMFTDDDLDTAEAALEKRGLMANGALTTDGRGLREAIEAATDAACSPIAAALGDDAEALIGLLSTWSAAVCNGYGYPKQGPHDLAELASPA